MRAPRFFSQVAEGIGEGGEHSNEPFQGEGEGGEGTENVGCRGEVSYNLSGEG